MEGRDFILQATAPLVGILACPRVKKIAEKNQIPDIVEFFRPFGLRINKSTFEFILVTTQDVHGNKITLDPAYIRFADWNDLDAPDFNKLSEIMLNHISEYKQVDRELPVLKTKNEVEKYREEGLIVLSSADPDPMQTIKSLTSESNLPKIFKKGYMDPNVVKMCLIIHDPEDSVNLDTNAEKSTVPDIWSPSLSENYPIRKLKTISLIDVQQEEVFQFKSRNSFSGQLRGNCLSQQDFTAIENFTTNFLATNVFQYISQQMKDWERDVASARRGISGRLFKVGLKYFGSSKSSSSQSSSFIDPETKIVAFPYNSPEMIMRKLGDYAFMVRDVKYAQSIYETAKKDFSTSEKYYKFFAGIHEMLAVCGTILNETSKAALENLHEVAVHSYNDVKVPLYGVRSTLWITELLKEHEMYRDCALSFIRMAKDVKYQKDHALRNYMTSLDIYGDLGWSLISDHINFTIGKAAADNGEYHSAIDYFTKLLNKSRQSPSIQRAYLSEFLYLYQQYSINVDMPTLEQKMSLLPLPTLHDQSIQISSKDPTSSSRRKTLELSDRSEIWVDMERELIDHLVEAKSKYAPKFKITKNKAENKSEIQLECAVGEPVHITFLWSNPLQVPIPINNVFLECSYEDSEAPPSLHILASPEPSTKAVFEKFDIEVLPDFALDSNDKRLVHLKVYPKVEGKIKIIGVRFLLCGIIPSFRRFDKKSLGANSIHQDLILNITAPMPVLEASFHNFPSEMLAGQVCQTILELNNKGSKGMEGLFVKMSHPSFCYFGDSTSPIDTPYVYPKDSAFNVDQDEINVGNIITDETVVTIKLPSNENDKSSPFGRLEAQSTTLIPIWIRADHIGKHNFRFLFVYQATDDKDNGTHRFLKVTQAIDVQSSLRVNIFTKLSPINVNEFVLGIDVTNVLSLDDLFLNQITSLSPSWMISKLSSNDEISSKFVPNENKHIYLKLTRKKLVSIEELASSPEFITTFALERMILFEDPKPFNPPEISLLATSIADNRPIIDTKSPIFRYFVRISKNNSRLSSISQHYPVLTKAQIKELFTKYWLSDLDILILYSNHDTSIQGHLSINGFNLSLEQPLPIIGWFSGLDSKTLAGRALFERTFRERKELISSLLKSRAGENSPVRILFQGDNSLDLNSRFEFTNDSGGVADIKVILGNTSIMHYASYDFEAATKSLNAVENIVPFAWIGNTKFTGELGPGELVELRLKAIFVQPGVYNVSQWKLKTKLSFPKSVIDAGVSSKLERVGGSFTQIPTTSHLINVF
ncbi:Trafficking protein particle complex 8 [Boothiomyces sp. JEL0838]|nr:Trafficking protein particle complex 8 [Boothiomyces sp. JEL0838]